MNKIGHGEEGADKPVKAPRQRIVFDNDDGVDSMICDTRNCQSFMSDISNLNFPVPDENSV